MHRKSAFRVLLLACAMGSLGAASAQTVYNWNGTAGGSLWTTPANWTTGGTAAIVSPGNAANDTATINAGSSSGSPVTLNNGLTTTIGTLNLGSTVSGSAYLLVSGTGTILRPSAASSLNVGNGVGSTVGITVNGGGELDFALGTGNLVFGSGSNATVNITVGGGTGSTGILRNSASSASVTRLSNQQGTNTSLTVNTGGQVFLPGQFLVGSSTNSTAALNVNGGSLSVGTSFTLSQNLGATSSLGLTSGTISIGTLATFNVGSTATISGGLLTMPSGFGLSSSGSYNQSGGVVSVGTGFTLNSGAVATVSSGSIVTTAGGSARLTVTGASLSIEGGFMSLTGNTSTIAGGSTVGQSGGSVTLSALTIGNGGAGGYNLSGGSLTTASVTVGSSTNSTGIGTFNVTGGSYTSGAGVTVGSGTAVLGGTMGVTSSGTVRLNSGNGASVNVAIGTNLATGAAGTLLLQGGTLAPAAGATNGFSVVLATPATITSSATASTIQGYGAITVGGTGSKTFTNGGKVIATGANLVNNTGATPTDHTLDFTGATFVVNTTANRAAGSGWYAVNHGKLSMNMSGTASGTTLNWGAPTGAFSSNSLVNSAQLTFNASTAPSAISISLLATDRTDIAALFGQAGLPAGSVIGLWDIENGSANTWTGLTLRYDDALASGQSPLLYFIPDALGTWSQVATTVDLANFVISDNVASLNSGYYALLIVPEPGSATLLAAGALLLLGRRNRTRRIA